MSAASYDITIDQGATFRVLLRIKEQDGITPVNLTGSTFRGSIKRKTSDPSSLADFVCTVTADQTTYPGEVMITLAKEVTAALPTVTQKNGSRTNLICVYDIERVYDAGVSVDRVMQGRAIISPEVTT